MKIRPLDPYDINLGIANLPTTPRIVRLLSNCIWYCIGLPLKILYFNGPSIYGFGFWEGRSGEDICSQLTNVDSAFWKENPSVCVDILDKKFGSFALSLGILVYFILLITFTKECLSRMFLRRRRRCEKKYGRVKNAKGPCQSLYSQSDCTHSFVERPSSSPSSSCTKP